MPSDPITPLTPEEVETAAGAILANAVDLIDEAKILLRESHFARAEFLAGLALEEMAKVPLLAMASAATERGVAYDWAGLRSVLRKHPIKVASLIPGLWVRSNATGSFTPFNEMVRQVEWIKGMWSKRRESAAYVDPFTSHRGKTPNEAVTQKDAQSLISAAEVVLAVVTTSPNTAKAIRAMAAGFEDAKFHQWYAELAKKAATEAEESAAGDVQ